MGARTVLRIAVPIALLGVAIATSLPLPRQAVAQSPTPFLISPYFGQKSVTQWFDPPHNGIDFNLSYDRVLGGAYGTVYWVAWYNDNCYHYWDPQHPDQDPYRCGYGLNARIDHGNGYQTIYAHLSAVAFNLGTTGVLVNRGQVIATSGNTGWSSGAHLHFETRLNGVGVDPFNPSLWIDGQWANPSRPIPTPVDGTTIIVDDQSASFTKGCINSPNCPYWWEEAVGYNNHIWWTLVNGDVPDYWAQWNPSIPQYGIYEVYVYIPSNNATSWQARYTVSHYDGQSTGVIDQNGLYNQWVSIGVYRFDAGPAKYVKVTDGTGEGYRVHCYDEWGSAYGWDWCHLGVDAVKFVQRAPTYLPDIRVNSGGWNSSLIVRSNGGGAFLDVNYYNQNGQWIYTSSTSYLAGNAIWEVPLPASTNTRSAVIHASQDVAVGVMNIHEANPYTAAAYTGLDQTASTLYLPLYHNNNYGWYSDFRIVNAGTAATDLTVTLISSSTCSRTFTAIQPNGSVTVTPNWCGTGAGGAKVTSSNGQPLAAVVNQWKDYTGDAVPDSYMAYEGFPTPVDLLPLPLLMRNNYNYNSGIALQDASGTSNTGTVNYYYHSGANNGAWCQAHAFALSANGLQAFYPAPPNGNCTQGGGAAYVGSGVADGNQVLAGMVNQVRFSVPGDYNATNYSSPRGGTHAAAVPLVMKNRDGWRGKNDWYTGLAVQNLEASQATVTVIYYYSSGDYVTSESKTVPAYSTGIFNPAPAGGYDGLVGSAWVTADRNIAVVSNHLPNPNGTADAFMTNNGVNR